jgi:molybdopterin synthase catalytic subunit
VGSSRFAIVRGPVDASVLDDLERAGAGAIVTFVGIVRARSGDGAAVSRLSYEAYEPMAIGEFEAIGAEVRERFGDVALVIVHAVGELCVGENAVVIGAAAPHRGAAFDACRYAIEQIKARAPIWKKERYEGGGAVWKAND